MTMDPRNAAARDDALVDKIGKLLAHAAGTQNDAERETYTARAMDLIAANNLDMAAIEVGGNSAKAARRTDEKHSGGLYQFQRNLWRDVSDLNFCMYWNLKTYDKDRVSKYWVRKYGGIEQARKFGKIGGFRFEHRLVGRTVNVASTLAMVRYLENEIERQVKKRLPDQPNLWFSSEMNVYREGMADEIRSKIRERRNEQLAEEQRKAAAAEEAEAGKYKAGNPTGTGITLSSVKASEADANYDFIHGDGASAKKRAAEAANRAYWAKWDLEQQEKETKWAEENPKEAAAQAAKERARQRRQAAYIPKGRASSSKRDKYDNGEYWRGRETGKSISIDPQMGGGAKAALK